LSSGDYNIKRVLNVGARKMSEDLHSNESDVKEVVIEPEEAASPLDQLKGFDKWWRTAGEVVLFALPCLFACLLGTFVLADGVLRGAPIPISVCVLMCLVSLVVSLSTVAPLRRWFSRFLQSPTGCVASWSIRFLGGMLLLLCILLALGLGLSPERDVKAWQCLLLASWLGLGLLMRFFPRGELK
jgi:hypothetical protein